MTVANDIDIHDLIILVITAAVKHDVTIGRTMLQKTCYFIIDKLEIKNDFLPHYYGPYSPTLTKMLADLIELDFIYEINSMTEKNRNLYHYYLTEKGISYSNDLMLEFPFIYKITEKIVKHIKSIDGDKIETISFAAKIYYINKKNNNIKSFKDIVSNPLPNQIYGWNLENEQLINNGKQWLISLEE